MRFSTPERSEFRTELYQRLIGIRFDSNIVESFPVVSNKILRHKFIQNRLDFLARFE